MSQDEWETEARRVDREDLLALLQLRFGNIPGVIEQTILQMHKPDIMQRLILVAANAPDWKVFLKELQAGDQSFRLVGEDFNPLKNTPGGKG